MQNPELSVIALNTAVVLIAYFFVYPRYCGADFKKISNNDLIASLIPLFIVGSIFWGTDQAFSMILFSLNWFWFTVLTYLIIEIPLIVWYVKKYDVFSQNND